MKVSVIIPVYNVELYIAECLDSVVNQTIMDIEIIVINDCSEDNSWKIVEEYANKDSRFVLEENKVNKGLSETRNIGLKLAKGDYIYMLDSDDCICPNALEKLYIIATQRDVDGVFFDAKLLFENEKLREKKVGYLCERKGTYPDTMNGIETMENLMINNDWTSSVPRQFWNRKHLIDNNILFYTGILHEDQLFSIIATAAASKICVIKDKLFIRRFREGSIMTSKMSIENAVGYFSSYYYAKKYFVKKSIYNIIIEKYLRGLINKAKKIATSYYEYMDRFEINKNDEELAFAWKIFEDGIINDLIKYKWCKNNIQYFHNKKVFLILS